MRRYDCIYDTVFFFSKESNKEMKTLPNLCFQNVLYKTQVASKKKIGQDIFVPGKNLHHPNKIENFIFF